MAGVESLTHLGAAGGSQDKLMATPRNAYQVLRLYFQMNTFVLWQLPAGLRKGGTKGKLWDPQKGLML